MPITDIKRTLPMSEIRLWRAHLGSEHNLVEKQDYYLAQIAMAIHQLGGRKKAKIKDYLIRFRKPVQTVTPETAKSWMKNWVRSLAGVAKLKKTKKVKKPRGNEQ